jgi:glycosyltransferase involved in cell wall biosynthesis
LAADLSVLILTLNEEKNLERCLEAVRWSDDVIVFDSFSTDRTVEIARDWGARVVQRKFDREPVHRTASLRLGFKHRWVFNPDADEIATPELAKEMRAVIETCPPEIAAFRMRRKDMFMGRWIRHSSLYPTWLVRLFRPEAIRFERNINLRYLVTGPEDRLQHHLLHYSFNKGLDEWIAKHNRYSRAEAFESLASLSAGEPDMAGLFSPDPVRRRRALKEESFLLPFRPAWRFFYMYLVRLGICDGAPGFHYCCLLSFYEYMISIKTREILAEKAGMTL